MLNNIKKKARVLNKRYVVYNVIVTKNRYHYSKGRMNGQLLAKKFIVPRVKKDKPSLVLDVHENNYRRSGYRYAKFLYPISKTKKTNIYMNHIIKFMPKLKKYNPPNPTSPQYVTKPIAKKGITTIIFETYRLDKKVTKVKDTLKLLNALDKMKL